MHKAKMLIPYFMTNHIKSKNLNEVTFFNLKKVFNVFYTVLQKNKPNKFYPRKSFLNFRMQVVYICILRVMQMK